MKRLGIIVLYLTASCWLLYIVLSVLSGCDRQRSHQEGPPPVSELLVDVTNLRTEITALRADLSEVIAETGQCRLRLGDMKLVLDTVVTTWPWRGRTRLPETASDWTWPAELGQHVEGR